MYENLETKTVTARKRHKCDWCGKPISKGEEYERQKFKYDGEFGEWKAHLSCSRVASAIWDYADPDEGMGSDQFDECCAEVCRVFVCPGCPEWNKEYGCKKNESYCIDRMDEFFKTHELYRAKRNGDYEAWKCRERRTDDKR